MNEQAENINHPQELLSSVRRAVNALREKQTGVRHKSLTELLNVTKTQVIDADTFDEIMQMALKEVIRCYYDSSEANRELAVNLTIQLLSRCKHLSSFLPYVFEALKDRTNCVDLEGIDKLPQKMRPQPGQKPKMLTKLIQQCEEIRLLYCSLLKRIILLVDKDKHEMMKHIDDMVNILRALVMDPAPEIQRTGCQTLQLFCEDFKDLLLHFTETMGRAVLLPLVSKKSKIRIAALNTLSAIFWCGLWKYNAFVFENLIGFRDPNSVPIKDFYQPSNNINYLATFINQSNIKVRRQFMTHLKTWICDLNDKYDHHSKLVPYLLSGLFDSDEEVKETALKAIVEIGKQIQEEKQKDFRENKQFAIDAQWTWEGKLVDLPVDEPLKKRPSLGSRFFVRGHVRRFWNALYKQIRDINLDNRLRSAKLALYGVIFTQNYLTQFLDNLIPQLLPSIIALSPEDKPVADIICKIFFYIGRYCEQSGYFHLINSALDGKLIQNEEFIRCAMKGLSKIIEGSLEAIPEDEHLCHKKQNIVDILNMLQECEIAGDVYNFNCAEVREIAVSIIRGIEKRGSPQETRFILSRHYSTLMKLLAVTYYEEAYSSGFSWKKSEILQHNLYPLFENFRKQLHTLQKLYPESTSQLQDYLAQLYDTPPTLMDSDWKILITLYHYLLPYPPEDEHFPSFLLLRDVLSECLSVNRSVDTLLFTVKFMYNLLINFTGEGTGIFQSSKIICECLKNLAKFKPTKKVPVYDQHLVKQDNDINILKTVDENYFHIFIFASKAISSYALRKISLPYGSLASICHFYIEAFDKIKKNKDMMMESIKTIWALFQRLKIEVGFADEFIHKQREKNQAIIPQVIDFCVQRIEEYLDTRQSALVFGILMKILGCWPKMKAITDKVTNIYPQYPELLDKFFKYTLNEKDIETHQKYITFLSQLARSMPDWFKYEHGLAEKERRYEKTKLLKDILYEANVSLS